MAKPTIEEAITAYRKLRDTNKELEDSIKPKLQRNKELMLRLEDLIKVEMEKQGVQSFKTKAGTAYVTTTHSASVKDKAKFWEFVKIPGNEGMIEKRAAKTAVLEYIKKDGEIPPGIDITSSQKVGIRKPA